MDVEMYLNPDAGTDDSLYFADVAVAHAPYTQAAVVGAALDRAALAEGVLLAHADTGNSRIDVTPAGEPDILVSLVDPRDGENGMAAMGIERETNALSTAFGIPPIRDLLREDDTGYSFLGGD